MCSAAAPEATEREAKMNMTVSVKERIPKQRTERRAYVTERARESDSLLVRTDRPGLSMQYKLIATTDASLSDAEKHLRTVYSVLIIKTEQDLFGITDETVFIYDVARNRDAADRLLALLAGGCVSPSNAKDVITIIFEYDEQYLREIDNGDFSDQRVWLFIPQILFFDAPLRTAASARAFRSRQN